MNKLKLLLIGAVSIVLVGCDSNYYVKKATSAEITMIQVLNAIKHNSCTVKASPVREAIYNRATKPPETNKPFQDIEGTVRAYDSSIKCETTTTTLQQLYTKMYKGKTLFGEEHPVGVGYEEVFEEEEEVVETITPTKEEISSQIVDDTITLYKTALLSPEKVRQLTQSAKTCNRAKVKLLSLTEGGNYLTIDDYAPVTKLILDCTYLEMETELNK